MEALFVALVAGFVGGVGAKLLDLRGSRLAQLRERQLAAADEFAAAATEVYIRLGAEMEVLGSPVGREAQWRSAFRDVVGEARHGVHEATRRLPRIELLFGRGSEPAVAAVEAVESLHRMTAELMKDDTAIALVTQAFEAGADALGGFTDRAHASLTTPVWKRAAKTSTPAAADASRELDAGRDG